MNDPTTATLAFGGTAATLVAYWLWLRWQGPRLEAEAAAKKTTSRGDRSGGQP